MDLRELNLRHLKAFAATNRLGSVLAAARAVNLSQPAVTQAIGKLETQLDAPLFERRSDGMSPTPAALAFAPRVEAALGLVGSPRVTAAQVGALIALARAGSYAGASAIAGISEPSLHRAVRDLELTLDQKLVERRGRGLALTARGQRLARAFKLSRVELAAGVSELRALDGRDAARIVIGAMPLCRARVLPAAIAAMQIKRPGAEIAVVEGAHADLIEPLRDGDLDLLIGALRDPPPGPDVAQTKLFDDRPAVVARRGHPLAGARRAPHLSALGRYPWILPAPGAPLRDKWIKLYREARLAPPRVPIECGSVITIRQILLEGDYLTLVSPDQVRVELEGGQLVVIRQAPPELTRAIGMTTRADWRPTAIQQEFIAELRDACAPAARRQSSASSASAR
ncbi:MAG: LysR substrate-binding domain-containing protein [Maricaulaceae bacterium]|jgi:DNA-binding transcriptional LysR family regulator